MKGREPTRTTVTRRPATMLRFLMILALWEPALAEATPPDASDAPAESVPWEFSASGYYYALPDDDDVPVLVATANHGRLQLEARYNYEDLKTASVFAGWTFRAGEAFTMDLTPLAGAAFGQTNGIVPALEVSLGYGMFDFYAESEYLFDVEDESNNFLYSWLELGVAPIDVLRAGLTAQRTRVFESPLEVDRGIFAQWTPGWGALSVYTFNLFTDSRFLVFGLEVAW